MLKGQSGNDDIDYSKLTSIVGQNNMVYEPGKKNVQKSNLPQLDGGGSKIISYAPQVHNPQTYHETKQDNNYQSYEQSTNPEETKTADDKQEESDDEEENFQPTTDQLKQAPQEEQDEEAEGAQVVSLPQQQQQAPKNTQSAGPQNQQQLTQDQQQQQVNRTMDTTVTETKILTIELKDIIDIKQFLMRPCPRGAQIQCTIKRDRSGFNRFFPKYHCFLSHGPQYLMTGKKKAYNKTSNYLLSYKKDELKKKSLYYLGKLRSNFMGTEFNVYDGGENPKKTHDPNLVRENLGVVIYESNLLGARGPRKMKVLIPEVKTTGEIYSFKPMNPKEGIANNMKSNRLDGIKVFYNKPPKWNDQVQAYVLNFNGRVEKPSVKNFQLIDDQDEDKIYMQFGRVSNDTFNMDFEWPLSPFQAFAISLSSFDYKIACE